MSIWDGEYESGAELYVAKLMPGDVELIGGLLSSMLLAPLTDEQAYAVKSAQRRLFGRSGSVPPNLPIAIADVVDALVAGNDSAKLTATGTSLLEAVCSAGYATNVNVLRQALDSMALRLLARKASGGDDKGKATADGIDWYEPGDDRFYSPDAVTGPILRNLIDDLRHASRYIDRGIPAPTRCLFVGAPGNGKTSAAKYLGRELSLPVALIRLDGISSPLLGMTAKNLRACCEAAMEREAIIFIDEFDSLGTRRDNASPNVSDEHKKTTGAVLQLFDALPQEQIVVACANVASAIDPASARRFKTHVHFGPPDDATRRAIGAYHWRKMSVGDGALDKLVEVTAGRSGDTTEKVAHEAARTAIRREVGLASIDGLTSADVVAASNAQPQEGKLADGARGVPPAAVNAVLHALAAAIRGAKLADSSSSIIFP